MTDASGPACPVDLADGVARVGDDPEFYKELLDLFLEDAPSSLVTLREAIDQASAEEASRTAHGLKGAAANLSAIQVRDLASEIEELGRAGITEGLDSLCSQLSDALDQLIEFAKTL